MAGSNYRSNSDVEIALTRVAVGMTLLVSFLLGYELINTLIARLHENSYWKTGEEFLFLAIITFFVYGIISLPGSVT
jgi:hypothetical protein